MFSTISIFYYCVSHCIGKQQIILGNRGIDSEFCFVASQHISPAFFSLVPPCCKNVNRLIVVYRTSIQKSTLRSNQYIPTHTAPVLTQQTCNIYLIIRNKSWLEDAYGDE